MSGSSGKPDFSNVQGGHAVTGAAGATPDFGNVQGHFDSSAPVLTPTTYSVKSGDSLSRIARKVYGSSSHWRIIFDANRGQIDNPDLIHPGQELTLPPLPAVK